MKIFALFFCFVVSICSAFSLKNDVCGLEHSKNGDGLTACEAFIQAWSYNPEVNECVHFIYGGCLGNDNRFDSPRECEDVCKE